jgi:hypothetical protein
MGVRRLLGRRRPHRQLPDTRCTVELFVRPDDLARAATALRQAHTTLAARCVEFETVARRLAAELGPQAGETAESSVVAAAQAGGCVEDDLATFAQGLTAAAAYYAAVDGEGLTRLRLAQ